MQKKEEKKEEAQRNYRKGLAEKIGQDRLGLKKDIKEAIALEDTIIVN